MDSGLAEALFTRGGPVALLAALGFALKYAVDFLATWYRNRRATDDDEQPKPSPVADAATTNALLLDSFEKLQASAARKDERIDELEAEVESERNAKYELQRAYEQEIGELRAKVQEVTLRLAALQARIGTQLGDANA